MPYIPQEDRDGVRPKADNTPENAGQLNFQISSLCSAYMRQHGMRYQNMNDVIGALQGALMEFNRVVVGPYEDQKIEQNGEVYSRGNVGGPNAY
jgi:hypothetical protein